VHSILNQDLGLNFTQTWSNDVCFTSGKHNDMTKLNDTLWLCVLDEAHATYRAPVDGIVTSRYGYRHGRHHSGIDLDLETGDTVRSCWAGKVRYAKYNDGGFGNLVIVRHYNGLETLYAHLSKLIVAPDQEVKAGDVLGLGGNTGRSYGSHLHFEVRFYDAAINPEEVIDFDKKINPNECVYNELCNFSISEYKKKGLTKIGIVLNTDPHTSDGSHWICLFININEMKY
jgi:hypothetical protein